MRSPSSRAAAGAIVVLASLTLTLPATTAADSQYPPDPAARGFSGGLAGWSGSTGFDGSCLPPLLCPSVTNSHQASGGADGGGFVRSAYQGVAGAMAVAGTSTAVWTSPTFTYSGDGGGRPDAVSFRMDRRASVDQLLAVSGNSATYSVRLANLSEGGETISLIPPTTLAGAKDWRSVASAPVDPDRLDLGDEYRLLITSTYVTGTSALASGSADYDNVTLRAGDESGAGNRKAKGKDGGGSGNSERSLLDLLRASAPGTAAVVAGGKRLLVAVKCPAKLDRTCRMSAQGLLRKGRPATARRSVKVRKGKRKLVALRVKPKARSRMIKRKRLLVRQKVRVGKRSATLVKSRKLIRRG
jgi:hypothetical protein